jgi:acetoin utilization deacetylase AcuC-like enzyme
MQVFYSDVFVLPLPSRHRFPMGKYRRLRDRIATEHASIRLQPAPEAGDAELVLVHTREYIAQVANGTVATTVQREIGFPWSPAMAERARRSVGATLAAARAALGDGIAANLAGGTHHAKADRGAGFCVFNDVAVAARAMQRLRPGLQVAVIDLDVHQGDGTAAIFRDDTSVFTLSLHGAKNYPFRKQPGDLDVELPDGCGDADYLAALDDALTTLWRSTTPGLLFYLAGVDPHERDRLGRLALTAAGLAERDRRVFAAARARGIPLVLTMAGGYGEDIEETVQLQVNTFRAALAVYGAMEQSPP